MSYNPEMSYNPALTSDYFYNEYFRKVIKIKQKHMKHTILYRKFVKKLLQKLIKFKIPDVLEKIVFNFVGSSKFPNHLPFYPKNIALSRLETLDKIDHSEQ